MRGGKVSARVRAGVFFTRGAFVWGPMRIFVTSLKAGLHSQVVP